MVQLMLLQEFCLILNYFTLFLSEQPKPISVEQALFYDFNT